jgi:hypothetical protein
MIVNNANLKATHPYSHTARHTSTPPHMSATKQQPDTISSVDQLLLGQLPRYRAERSSTRPRLDVRRQALYTHYPVSEDEFFRYKAIGVPVLTALFLCDTRNWLNVTRSVAAHDASHMAMAVLQRPSYT